MTGKTENKVIWGAILLYIVFFGVFVSLRHYNFQTQTWDLGIFDQTFWNTIHGRIMFNNIEEVSNHLGVHMSPFLFLLVPGYALFPSPYYLLIVQTIVLALGAVPLYLLAKRLLPDRSPFPLILSLGYLLYPSLHWVNIFDFHPIAFVVPLLLAAFYFLHQKNWLWSGIFLALAASAQEDAIPVVLFVGLFLLIQRSGEKTAWLNAQRKFGLAVIFISIFYFLLSTQIIMPALGGGLLRMDRYASLGNTPAEIVQNVFKDPMLIVKTIFTAPKLRYILWLFLPVAFLPLFSAGALALLIPGLAENLLTTFESQFTGFYQYDSVLIAGIFVGSIYGLKMLLGRWPEKEKIAKYILVAAILIGFIVRSPASPISFPLDLFKPNPHWEAFRQMAQMVPPGASVAAQTNLVPHLTQREHAYMLGTEPFLVDIVLIDGADLSGFTEETFQAYADGYMNSGQYNFKVIDERYFILSKKTVL